MWVVVEGDNDEGKWGEGQVVDGHEIIEVRMVPEVSMHMGAEEEELEEDEQLEEMANQMNMNGKAFAMRVVKRDEQGN